MRVTINLATRPFADLGPILKRLRIAMVAFAVVSIGLGIGVHFFHSKAEAARAHDHSLDGQITRINQERQGYETMMRQPDNAIILQEAANLNRLFDQKAFSWTLAMEDLETVLPGGVQVTTLEPLRDEKTSRITLRLRVVGPRDKALDLVQNLEHSRHFLRPTIVGESTESSGGPGERLEPVSISNKVNFDLNAEYNPATVGEKRSTDKKPEASSSTTVTAHSAKTAAGPGLRRPPLSGVSHSVTPSPSAGPPPHTAAQPHLAKPRAGGPQ